MRVTTYSYDAEGNRTGDPHLNSTTHYYYDRSRGEAGHDAPATSPPGAPGAAAAVDPFTDEQRALLDLVGEAARALSMQQQRAFWRVADRPSSWPAEKDALEGLIRQVAHRLLAHLAADGPEPDVVVPPPEHGGDGGARPPAP
jgi:hypothetical protein